MEGGDQPFATSRRALCPQLRARGLRKSLSQNRAGLPGGDNQWQFPHHNSSAKNSVTCALLSALRVAGLLVTSVLAAAVRH